MPRRYDGDQMILAVWVGMPLSELAWVVLVAFAIGFVLGAAVATWMAARAFREGRRWRGGSRLP